MCHDLGIDFPVLSDVSRRLTTSWGLLNTGEKGGIAFPATFLIDRGLLVRFAATERTTQRVPATEMLRFVKTITLEGDGSTPRKRPVHPGAMFFHAIVSIFRHGVRVDHK